MGIQILKATLLRLIFFIVVLHDVHFYQMES